MSMGLTETRTLGAAAHSSLEILVFLRTAASAEASLSPMLFSLTLWVRARSVDGEKAVVSRGADTKANTLGQCLTPGW